jgi:hypothetical protein
LCHQPNEKISLVIQPAETIEHARDKSQIADEMSAASGFIDGHPGQSVGSKTATTDPRPLGERRPDLAAMPASVHIFGAINAGRTVSLMRVMPWRSLPQGPSAAAGRALFTAL